MSDNGFKGKNFSDHDVEEKIFRAGSQLYCSCVAYDVISDATLQESLGSSEEFHAFILELIKAGERKKFIARDRALHRLISKE